MFMGGLTEHLQFNYKDRGEGKKKSKMCLDDGQRRDKPNTLILCYPSVLP